MSGGDPPLPPSRLPYAPWQARPYRRRGGGPPTPRNGWVGRRPRSPPPNSRPRLHPRGAPPPHRHQRHLPHPHPPSQSHPPPPHQQPYHHHHHHHHHHHPPPPPLSRNLQARLRSPPRSPQPRRPDLPLHPRDDLLRTETHQPDRERERLDQHRSEPLRQETHRTDSLRPDPPDHHRPDQHRPDLPYRGQPGPPHRLDPPERPHFRLSDSYPPPTRGPPPKLRTGDPSPFRSDQRLHRPPAPPDHHVPYRGEPGPLYRADLSSHRGEIDSRRPPSDAGPPRPDSTYSPWYRHPSKIHKPVKRKLRRHPPHIPNLSRPLSMSKPESPILSRMSFPPAERPGVASRTTDPMPSSAFNSSKLSSSFPSASSKWHTDPSPRFSAIPPRISERDPIRRLDRGPRPPGSAALALKKRQPPPYREQSRSPKVDSFFSRGSGAAAHGFVLTKSQSSEEQRATDKSSRADICNGRNEDLPEDKEQGNAKDEDRDQAQRIAARDSEKVSCNAVSTLHRDTSQNQVTGPQGERSIPKAETAPSGLSTSGSSLTTPRFSRKATADASKDENVREVKEERKTEGADSSNRASAEGPSNLNPSHNGLKDSAAAESSHSTINKSRSVAVETHCEADSKVITASRMASSPACSPGATPPSQNQSSLQSTTKQRIPDNDKAVRDNKPASVQPRAALPLAKAQTRARANISEENRDSLPLPDLRETVNKKQSGVPGLHEEPKSSGHSSEPPSPSSAAKNDESALASDTTAAQNSLQSHAQASKSTSAAMGSSATKVTNDTGAEAVADGQEEELKKAHARTASKGTLPERAVPSQAPVLPILNLRSILSSSGLTAPASATAKPTPTTPLPDLRSLLRPVTPVKATAKKSEGITLAKPSQSLAGFGVTNAFSPTAAGPVSVPAPALSFLRSSPRARARKSGTGAALSSLNSMEMLRSSASCAASPRTANPDEAVRENDTLLEAIHATEKQISAVERKLGQLRAERACMEENRKRVSSKSSTGDKEAEGLDSIAKAIAARVEHRDECPPRVSPEPLHASLRLVMVHNHAKAAAAEAALRPICSNPETGLHASTPPMNLLTFKVSEEVLAKVTEEVARRQVEVDAHKRKLSRDYRDLRENWMRKLKSARDKKSKEKREATKERDRFLVLRTKGHSALLTSRTSSGRMSTKIFPSLNTNGQVNNNAEVDALLAEIAAEGGTPGSKEIWSKTLADIPPQDISFVPCDSGSVLVEDPLADFSASRYVNPWHFEEKLVFLEKFVIYSKNFRKIASFLEHKSTRECSQFYYMNKLDLGLKQLAKESSTLKRKGTLKSHIVTLAKKRLNLESEESVAAHAQAFLLSQNLMNGSNHERGNSDSFSDLANGTGGNWSEKRKLQWMKMMPKKRIMAEHTPLEISDIDFDKFARAVAAFGTDWKKISSVMEMAGKTSTHYREFYRKNVRRLRVEESWKHSNSRLSALGRSPSPPPRQSPRTSLRGSPDPSPSPPQHRMGRSMTLEELDALMLVDEGLLQAAPAGSRRHRKSASPSGRSPTPQPRLSPELEARTSKRGESEGESRKTKTSTWTVEEGEKFRQLFKRYGRDWKKIAQIMSPKTPMQVKGYWRKVAHEVGHGHSVSTTKTSKSDKKRPRRSNSTDGFIKQTLDDDRKSSPDKKSPSSGHSATPYSEGTKRDAKRQRSEPIDMGEHENIRQDLKRASDEGNVRIRMLSGEVVEENDKTAMNGDMTSGRTARDAESGKTTSDEDTGAIGLGGRVPSSVKLPLLRSAPLPMFRSIPVTQSLSERSSAAGYRTSNASLSKDVRLRMDKKSEDGPQQAELRKTAESYGVLALLGSRLEDASNAQKGKR